MIHDLEYYLHLPIDKPEEISPRHALDVIYKHKSQNVRWMDELVAGMLHEIRNRLESYAKIELVCVCNFSTTGMADLVVTIKFHSNTDMNRLKLSKPDWHATLIKSDVALRQMFDQGEIKNRMPRYDDTQIRCMLNEL